MGIKKKVLDDPMVDMKKYLNIMRSKPAEECTKIKIENAKRKRCDSNSSSHSDQGRESHCTSKKLKKDKKHKKHKKSKRKEFEKKETESNINIEKLRAERILREQSEKLRTETLLAKVRGEPVSVVPPEITKQPTIKQKYNSQFFPELARQNAERTPKHMYNLDKV